MRRSLYKFGTLLLSARTTFLFYVFGGLERRFWFGEVHQLLNGEYFFFEWLVGGGIWTFQTITGMLLTHFGLTSFVVKQCGQEWIFSSCSRLVVISILWYIFLIIIFGLVFILFDVFGLGVCIGSGLLFLILSFRMIINGSSGRVSTRNFTCISSSATYNSICSCFITCISSSILANLESGSCVLGRYSY